MNCASGTVKSIQDKCEDECPMSVANILAISTSMCNETECVQDENVSKVCHGKATGMMTGREDGRNFILV